MDKDRDIIIAVVTASVLFLLFSVFTVSYFLIFRRRNKQHRSELDLSRQKFEEQLQQSRMEVQDTTYSILAKELHDNVGQLLTTSKMLMGITEREMKTVPETLVSANETLGHAIHELRTLSKSLDKDWLEQFSFSENIRTEVNRINSAAAIKAVFTEEAVLPLPAEKQIILFRIVQEAIQNAIKHSGSSNIMISLKKQEKEFQIAVTDDGKGPDDLTEGMGIGNMKHRTKIIGGEIKWLPAEGSGTNVMISLP